MAKKKKKGLSLVFLMLTMIALVVGYVVYSQYDQKKKEDAAKQEEEEAAGTEIFAVAKDSIQTLCYQKDGETITLEKDKDSKWHIKGKENLTLNDKVDTMLNALESVKAKKTVVEESDNLAEFKLTTDAVKIECTASNGDKQTLCIGCESPSGEENYACIDGQKTVYFIDKSVLDAFDYTEVALIDTPSTPSVQASQITKLKIEQKDKTPFEITYEETNPYSYSTNDLDHYVVTGLYEQPMVGNTETIPAYLATYEGFSYSSCVDYDCKDLSKYGLDDPMAIIQMYYDTTELSDSDSTESKDATKEASEEKKISHTYELKIGSLDEDGSAYYVMDSSSLAVQLMTKSKVDDMLTYNRFELIDKYPHLVSYQTTKELEASYEGETHKIQIDHKKKKDADGKEVDANECSFDGKSMEEETLKACYMTFTRIMYDAEIPEGYQDSDKKPVLTLKFTRTADCDKSEVVANYYKYAEDDSFYIVEVNGMKQFLVDQRNVQKAIDSMKELAQK